MITITTSSGDKLTLTHDHLVSVSDNGGTSWRYIFSEKTTPGQMMRVKTAKNELAIAYIDKVTRLEMQYR